MTQTLTVEPPDVLFVCVHNAGRSQIARALFNTRAVAAGLGLTADSAGTSPSDSVHTEVVAVMLELGIDLSSERGKLISDELLIGDPKVITMGCQVDSAACPAIFMADVDDWGIPDPKGRPIHEVRQIRDLIGDKVDHLIEGLRSASR